MDPTPLTRRLAASPLAALAALPLRLSVVGRYNANVLRRSASWLVTSRENSCFTYDLEPVNREHLAWFTATVTGRPVQEIRGYLDEVEGDAALRESLRSRLAAGARSRTCDHLVRYGRRAAAYAAVRALRPALVVDCGTHRGITATLVAAALLRNGTGRVTTVDVDPRAGELVHGPYAKVTDRVCGDSAAALADLAGRDAGLLLLDTYVGPEHERAELTAATRALAPGALVLSTTSHLWPELAHWSEREGRSFLHFREAPAHHWHPGAGYGASYLPPAAAPPASSSRAQATGTSR
ncbi:class I SAM-dependent methyltransferase [Streptomyces sp. NPDC059009]|uniref:class I SAM-dependent methyltransferase n=1 Tax=Streptomyces sp. NPDC059009 TaxID=3346694 RepID=UPI0036C582E2